MRVGKGIGARVSVGVVGGERGGEGWCRGDEGGRRWGGSAVEGDRGGRRVVLWCKASDPGCRRKRSNLVARLVPFLSLGYARLSPRERHAPHATVAEKRINTPALSVWGVYAVENAAKIRERDQRICGGDMEGGQGKAR